MMQTPPATPKDEATSSSQQRPIKTPKSNDPLEEKVRIDVGIPRSFPLNKENYFNLNVTAFSIGSSNSNCTEKRRGLATTIYKYFGRDLQGSPRFSP
jgi:hypothetical protein